MRVQARTKLPPQGQGVYLLALLSLTAACGDTAPSAEPEFAGEARLPATFIEGLVFVDVTMNGQATNCILDTGAQVVTLSEDVFGLSAGQAAITHIVIGPVTIDALASGLPASSFAGFSAILGRPVTCLLGWTAVRQLRLHIDYPNGELTLIAPENAAGAHLSDARIIPVSSFTIGTLGDSELGIDTGAQLTVLDADALADLFTNATCTYQYATIYGLASGELMRARVAGLNVEGADVAVGSVRLPVLGALSNALGMPVRGLLGATWLAGYTVEIHGPAVSLEVTPGDAVASAAARREIETALGIPEVIDCP